MTVAEQVEALKTRHAQLEQSLQEEITRPQPDQRVIAGIKKQKLKIKDELAQLSVQ